jgi:hypothetical protein
MKKIVFFLIGFTLFFISCEQNTVLSELKDDSISKITTRNYRVTIEQAINEVNSLLDIIDGNNASNGIIVTMNTKQRRIVKDVNVATNKSNDNGLTLMSAGYNYQNKIIFVNH